MLQPPRHTIWEYAKWCKESSVEAMKAKEEVMPRIAFWMMIAGAALSLLRLAGFSIPVGKEDIEKWGPIIAMGLGAVYVLMWRPAMKCRDLEYKLAYLKERRFEIECGEETTGHEGIMRRQAIRQTEHGPILVLEPVAIAFFGFRLINRGTVPAINCRATLIGIQDEQGNSLLGTFASALPFEAKNHGDDLDVVNIHQNVPQSVTVCSVFHQNDEVAAGSGNMKWRHQSINPHFKNHGRYDFIVIISDETEGGAKESQREVFRFHWKGNHKDSRIEHRNFVQGTKGT